MSYKALTEVCLNVHSFRNINLIYNGVYLFRFRLYQRKLNGRKIFAFPYSISKCFKVEPLGDKPKLQEDIQASNAQQAASTFPARIDEAKNEAYCTAVTISHIEGDADIEELILFRMEFDVLPELDDDNVYLEVEMLFYEFDANNNILQKNEENIIAKIEYKIDKMTSGIKEYVCGNFQGSHYSVLNMTLHTVLTEYRFRHINKAISELTESEIYKMIFDPKAAAEYESKETLQSFLANNLGKESIDSFCNRLLQNLKNQHAELLKEYNVTLDKCLFEKHKKKYAEYLQQKPSKLEIPDPLNDSEFQATLKEFNIDLTMVSAYSKNDPEEKLKNFSSESGYVVGELLFLWHKFLDLAKISPRFFLYFYEFDYQDKIKRRWQSYIKTTSIKTTDFCRKKAVTRFDPATPLVPVKMNPHSQKADLSVMDTACFSDPAKFPDVLEQQLILDTEDIDDGGIGGINPLAENYKGIHLVILIHGFQGNSFDMKLLKNNLLLYKPELLIYCSNKNEDNTEGDIAEMGRRLAEEIQEYIRDFCPGSALGRLSFIGYSLGGIIARACFPHLGSLHSKFHTFITLSSPHISFLYSSSSLFDAGLWILKKLKKSDALLQLTMSDNSNLKETFLYKLSQSTELSLFKNIVLFGSDQDTYSPFDSGTIQISEEILRDRGEKTQVYQEMVNNIITKLKVRKLYRVNIIFKNLTANLDSFLGRAAHIQYLESDTLVKMIVSRYESFFN